MSKQSLVDNKLKVLFLEKLRQNYQSLILGFLVFLVGISVAIKLISQPQPQPELTKKAAVVTKEEKIESQVDKYTVKEGDTLWAIAESHFGSGFNAYDIVKVNNIVNPDLIENGQELLIPSVEPKQSTKGIIVEAKTEKVIITESKYTVKQGDYLWKIALEAYGDGYQWVTIAKTNNLSNPDIIYAGTVLQIPR
jgi:nucleoid-associated protein YgaU